MAFRRITLTDSDIKRFWEKVDIKGPDACWLWTASITKDRGQFYLNGSPVLAPRVAYAIDRGETPVDLLVCHSCDVGLCVNPRHLFSGTHQDNSDDKWAKGRQKSYRDMPKGEDCHNSVLTEAQVLEIRRRKANGSSKSFLARDYGVANYTIFQIVNRLTWKHI